MSLLDLAARLRVIIDEIEATRSEQSFLVAKELVANVRSRVQNQKVDADGTSFGTYSTAVVPRWMLEKRAMSGGAKTRIRAGAWFQSYTDLREANNLKTDSIDFTFTGRLWQQTGVSDIQASRGITTVKIGGQTEYAKQILGFQEERHGNILTPNEEELQRVREAHEERILNIINRFL